MIELLEALETKLATISKIDIIRPISKIDELKGFDNYAITHQIINETPHKDRKGFFETPLFINIYSNIKNGEIAVLKLNHDIKNLLDESDLSNDEIRVYKLKVGKSSPQPEKNRYLDCWQTVVMVEVRWNMK